MGVIIFAVVALLAVSNTDLLANTNDSTEITEFQAQYDEYDEGDIGQIFALPQKPEEKPMVVVVEKPVLAQDCHASRVGDVMVRDLTVPYSQRRYVREDGSLCTPID